MKKIIIGFIVGIMVSLSLPSFASSLFDNNKVNDVSFQTRIKYLGQDIDMIDEVQNKPFQILNYENRTYVPIRLLEEMGFSENMWQPANINQYENYVTLDYVGDKEEIDVMTKKLESVERINEALKIQNIRLKVIHKDVEGVDDGTRGWIMESEEDRSRIILELQIALEELQEKYDILLESNIVASE